MSQMFQPILKIKKSKDIYWEIVAITLLRLMGISDKITFILMICWLALLFVHMKKIIFPKIIGMGLYTIFIVYAGVVGLVLNSTRAVSKDLFYILPSLVAIMIGYLLKKGYSKKSIRKSIYLSGTIISIYAFGDLFKNISALMDFAELRGVMGKNLPEVCIVCAAFLVEKIIYKREIFSRKKDYFILSLLVTQIALSLGRTSIGSSVFMIVSMFIFSIIIYEDKQRLLNLFGRIFVLLVVIIVVSINILPESALTEFTDKWENSTDEMNSQQEYDSTSEAMQNWRGYEIKSAKEQWKNSNILVMALGNGLGKGTEVKFVPYTWTEDIIQSKELPILHNCYYTILARGGIFGVVAIIWLLCSSIVTLFKYYKTRKDIQCDLMILAVVCMGILFIGYFSRGIVSQEYCFTWGLLMGSVNCKIFEGRKNISDKD